MGEPAGHDIAEGVYTMPVRHAPAERPSLAGLLRRARPGHAAGRVGPAHLAMLTELVSALAGRLS
jgi:hypothetical protein